MVEVQIKLGHGEFTSIQVSNDASVGIIRSNLSTENNDITGEKSLIHDGKILRNDAMVRDLKMNTQSRVELELSSAPLNPGESFLWNSDELYAFVHDPLTPDLSENSICFYQQNQMDKPIRMSILERLLHKLGSYKTPPVVMAFNSGFSFLFLNWVKSCDKYEIPVRERTIVFAMDKKSSDLAEENGFHVCFDENSGLLKSIGTSVCFGDAEFTKHMFFQNAIIRDMLDTGCDFLFQDVDIVWLRDPFGFFGMNGRYDIEFMYDGANPYHAPMHANTGFIYFHNRPPSRNFWNIIYNNFERVIQFRSQQNPVNKYLGLVSNRGLSTNILPSDLFANGHLFYPDPKYECRLPQNPAVVHCSWTNDIEQKLKKYKINGLWFLDT